MNVICLLEARDSLVIYSKVLIAQSLIVVYLPLILIQIQTFIKDFNRSFVSTKQVKGSAELLKIVKVSWIEQMALFEKFKTFMDVSFDSQDQCFSIQGILTFVLGFMKLLFY